MGKNKPRHDSWEVVLEMLPEESQLRDERFKLAWIDWAEDRRERHKALTKRAVGMQIRKLDGWGLDDAIRAMETSIANGWQGLFKPEQPRRRPFNGNVPQSDPDRPDLTSNARYENLETPF